MRSRARSTSAWLYAGAVTAAGVAVLVAALWYGGGRPHPAIEGLPSPGAITTWGLPLVRLAHDLCAIATVGSLLTAVVLTPKSSSAARPAIVRPVTWWALGWALTAAATFVLTLSDFVGLPLREALGSEVLISFSLYIPQGQAFLLVAVLAALIAVTCRLPLGAWGSRLLLPVAVFALLPPAYVGHSASAADHNLAVSSLVLHIAAASMWVGGLFGLLTQRRQITDLPTAVRRFSTLALCCFVIVGISGLINAWVRLAEVSRLWTTDYGLLTTGKLFALVALGWFGWRHRHATITALRHQAATRPFLRLAAGEIAVMTATVALAVALSRTAPPELGQAAAHNELLGYNLPPFEAVRLLTQPRLDPLIVLPLIAAAVGYLGGLRRISGSGSPWPVSRTAAWLGGLCLLGYALAGGLAAYAPAVFAAHAVQLALIGLVAPVLLAFGAPLTLALRATSPASPYRGVPRTVADSPLLRTLTHPAAALAAYLAPYFVLYTTGLFAYAQSSYAVRLTTQAVFIVGGMLFAAVIAGADPLPHPVNLFTRLRLLGTAVAAQAAVTLLLVGGPPQAYGWYTVLELPWIPPRGDDQQLGAVLGLGIAAGTLIVLMLILVRRHNAALRRLRQPARAA